MAGVHWRSLAVLVAASIFAGESMPGEKVIRESDAWGLGFRKARVQRFELNPPAEADPRINAILYRVWGNTLLTLGRFEEALKRFQEAQECAPADAENELAVGHALYAAGRISDAETAYSRLLNSSVAQQLAKRVRESRLMGRKSAPAGIRGLLQLAVPDLRERWVKGIKEFLAGFEQQVVDENAIDRLLVDRLELYLRFSAEKNLINQNWRRVRVLSYAHEVGWAYGLSSEGIKHSYQEDYEAEISRMISITDGCLDGIMVTRIDGDYTKGVGARITLKRAEEVFETELKGRGTQMDIDGLICLMNRVVSRTGDHRRFRYFDETKQGMGCITFLPMDQFVRIEKSFEHLQKDGGR